MDEFSDQQQALFSYHMNDMYRRVKSGERVTTTTPEMKSLINNSSDAVLLRALCKWGEDYPEHSQELVNIIQLFQSLPSEEGETW